MSVGRNEKCPCGSGKKYKKCCLDSDIESKISENLSPRFRFENGSYGGGGRPYVPSAICYEQIAPDEWKEHFCLVNPTESFDNEDYASTRSKDDLDEAFALGSDASLAACLKDKGYVKVEDFRRAQD